MTTTLELFENITETKVIPKTCGHLVNFIEGVRSLATVDEKIEAINKAKILLHEISPFRSEPVDCVLWVKGESVHSNDYNPNSVAPPEMELLRVSIAEDGYTQPIVTFEDSDNTREVVDGFHRNRVGKECADIQKRICGYLPVVTINSSQTDKGNRIASTIRHNRARGKHKVDAMSDIVIELKRRNWSTERICGQLGMDEDEVLRLLQITGLQEMFSNKEFSKSWEACGEVVESDFKELSDQEPAEAEEFRTVNTSDPLRVFHTYEKWECYKAGFYESSKSGMTKDECQESYREFLSNSERFSAGLIGVTTEWKHSCEHYLTNTAMNRIAWLGQAAACYSIGIPSEFRGGFNLLTKLEQNVANQLALVYLNKWLLANGRDQVTMEQASPDRESTIY
tara:strand:- start:1404 stop:2591 length:1188 start_codon:yes stop_codon:yes gene_type:complete